MELANQSLVSTSDHAHVAVRQRLMMMMALFIWLVIRLFQFVFLVRTVFFSHHKSVNSVFQPAYQHSRTGRMTDGCKLNQV
jgi:hypothetical protein